MDILLHQLIGLYLERNGWVKYASNRRSIDIYSEPNATEPFELLLPNNEKIGRYDILIKEAIKLLSVIENREEILVRSSITNIDHDLQNYKIETKPGESISINLLYELLTCTRRAIHQSAHVEHANIYSETPLAQKKPLCRRRINLTNF